MQEGGLGLHLELLGQGGDLGGMGGDGVGLDLGGHGDLGVGFMPNLWGGGWVGEMLGLGGYR